MGVYTRFCNLNADVRALSSAGSALASAKVSSQRRNIKVWMFNSGCPKDLSPCCDTIQLLWNTQHLHCWGGGEIRQKKSGRPKQQMTFDCEFFLAIPAKLHEWKISTKQPGITTAWFAKKTKFGERVSWKEGRRYINWGSSMLWASMSLIKKFSILVGLRLVQIRFAPHILFHTVVHFFVHFPFQQNFVWQGSTMGVAPWGKRKITNQNVYWLIQ